MENKFKVGDRVIITQTGVIAPRYLFEEAQIHAISDTGEVTEVMIMRTKSCQLVQIEYEGMPDMFRSKFIPVTKAAKVLYGN